MLNNQWNYTGWTPSKNSHWAKGLLCVFARSGQFLWGQGLVCLFLQFAFATVWSRNFFFLPFSSSFVQKEEGLWTRLAAVGDKKDLMARRERSLQNVRELSQEVLRNSYYWAVIDILDNLWFIIPKSELLVQFFLLLLDVTSKSSLYQTLIMRFFFSF